MMHNQILDNSEKVEHNLDRSKTYTFKFLFNGNQNRAADPEPFKLGNLDNLAKKAIGRPLVVPKWGDKMHVRSQKDTVEDQLHIQARYSVGEIVDTVKSANGNYYGIVEVWPEFEGMIKNNLIPDFTSPTIYVNQRDKDGQIIDAEFLNVQAVPVPGYEPELAGINGVCNGTKDTCMNELRTLAAASKLSMIRQDNNQFSNMLKRIRGGMSMEQSPQGANGNDITKALEGLQSMVKGNTETLEMIGGQIKTHGEVLISLAENVEGVNLDEVREKLGGGAPSSDAGGEGPGNGAMMGAAGKDDKKKDIKEAPKRLTSKDRQIEELNTTVKDYAKKYEDLVKVMEAKEAAAAKERRLTQANAIVDHLISIKQVNEADKEKKVTYYNELKNEQDQLVDLTLYANELKAIKPNIVASSGNEVLYRFPIPETSNTDKNVDKLKEFGVY